MSPELMKAMSTLTSVGIKRALVLGYIKRANRMEIYEELVGRLSHVIIAVMKELYPEMRSKLDKVLRLNSNFQSRLRMTKRISGKLLRNYIIKAYSR